MGKKYKSLLKYLVLSLIFIIIIATVRNVYSSYNPTREEFKNAEISRLLGKKLEFNGTLWKELEDIGQLSCFYHNQNSYNLMAEIYIHSVFDVGFDEQTGRMKITSMINDANKTTKTAYANSKNTSVGYLAAETARSNNAYGVYNALRKAIDEDTVVHEATIINQQEWWPSNVQNVETDQNVINLYNNYKRLSKEDTTYELAENTDVVTLNNKAYTVVGPLKVTFGGKDIKKITVGNATWTSKSDDSIFWSTNKKDWSSDFNKGTSAKYDLNNREFYIAVETSKLPASGKYKITMEQDKFEYKNSRTIVCTSVYAQQTGMYCYDNTPTPVVGKTEWEVTRIPTDRSLIIAKKDKTTGEKVTGAGFKIYAVLNDGTKGWVSGALDAEKKYEEKAANATQYADDVEIKSLKLGKYYVFETKAPEGYNIIKQLGYKMTNSDIPDIKPTESEWAYVGTIEMTKASRKTNTASFTAYNLKVVDKLEGRVWEDIKDTKQNEYDHVYRKELGDKLIQGIPVTLYNNNGTAIATTTTDENGYYCFTEKDTGNDKNLYYWELDKGHVEFTYNSKKYVCVDLLAGNDDNINSKAQEYTVTTAKLNDSNIQTETEGKAVTDKSKTALTNYYDNKTYTISNINLGLVEKVKPDFTVKQELEYIKVKMNGYTYTYKYGEEATTSSDYVAIVREQTDAKRYTASIYPSDIAYNKENQTDSLKVYAIYKINVENDANDHNDDIYNEQKLYLQSLENEYDTERFELSPDDNKEDKNSKEFILWTDSNGKANYNLKDETSAFKDGITHDNPISTHIQFRVKEEALQKLLEHKLINPDKAASTVMAKGYHEYLRTDNAWVHDESVYAFEGFSGSNYDKQNKNGDKYYVHKSEIDESKAESLYLTIVLKKARTISGKVYEDFANNGALGNGIIDENETNRATEVIVDLLKADKKTVAELYKVNEDGTIVKTSGNLPLATTKTAKDGTYSFEGLVPGYYYIRFTYGDGTQKIVDTKGNVVDLKSSVYKSTIIDSSTEDGKKIKAINEASEDMISNAQQALVNDYNNEAAKELVEWYKYIGNSYSTALDDIKNNKDKHSYTQGEITEQNVEAYTPIFGISIENDKTSEGTEHKGRFDTFNFGIIKSPEVKTKLTKDISNVKLTNQASMTNISASPKDKEATYISEIDNMVRLEIEQNQIYGSDLEVEYVITITNESPEDYIEKLDSSEYGYYYLYGEKTNSATQKGVTIEEVQDMIDEIYGKGEIKLTAYYVDGTAKDQSKITITPIGTQEGVNVLSITGMKEELKPTQSETIKYTAHAILGAELEDENGIVNDAKVTKIGLAQLTKPNIPEWPEDGETITLMTPAGSDRTNTYYVAGAIALIVLATGIVILKKKVL